MRDRCIKHPHYDFDEELQKIRTILLDLHVRIDKLENSHMRNHTRPSLSSSSSDSSIASIEAD